MCFFFLLLMTCIAHQDGWHRKHVHSLINETRVGSMLLLWLLAPRLIHRELMEHYRFWARNSESTLSDHDDSLQGPGPGRVQALAGLTAWRAHGLAGLMASYTDGTPGKNHKITTIIAGCSYKSNLIQVKQKICMNFAC